MTSPTRRPEGYFIAVGIPIGLVLGLPLGLAMGHLALGPALGLPLGLVIGLGLERRYNPDPIVRSEAKTRVLRRVLIGLVVGLVLLAGIAALVVLR